MSEDANYHIGTLDDSGDARWDHFVTACPEATLFHRAGWRRVIERVFGHRARFLYAERDGQIRAILPLVHVRSLFFGNALISNAFCIGGGSVGSEDEACEALDRQALQLMEELGADYLEYRQPVRLHEGWASRSGLYATFAKPIEPDPDKALAQIPRKQRPVVRRGIASGVVDVVDDTVDRLYDLFAGTMHRHGTPVFARDYLVELKRAFGPDCEILTAMHGGQPVSSVLSFYFRDRVMPYYAGVSPAARDLGANDFLYWRLMRRAIEERGCRVFDFGRSKVGTGPYAYKKNWGFEPTPVVHEFHLRKGKAMPDINPLNPRYQLLIALWKRLPLGLANLIGPHIVRSIG
ncbi:MAG: FemAB family PEP-CTERM system-associated protein [Alphaproteobacteria bacterium]